MPFAFRKQAPGDSVVFIVGSSNLVRRTLAVVEVVKRLVGGLHQTSSFVESAATSVSLGWEHDRSSPILCMTLSLC